MTGPMTPERYTELTGHRLPRVGQGDILYWQTKADAEAFVRRQPIRSQRRMVTLDSGAEDGWLVEWHRSDGHTAVKRARGLWSRPFEACRTCSVAP